MKLNIKTLQGRTSTVHHIWSTQASMLTFPAARRYFSMIYWHDYHRNGWHYAPWPLSAITAKWQKECKHLPTRTPPSLCRTMWEQSSPFFAGYPCSLYCWNLCQAPQWRSITVRQWRYCILAARQSPTSTGFLTYVLSSAEKPSVANDCQTSKERGWGGWRWSRADDCQAVTVKVHCVWCLAVTVKSTVFDVWQWR